MIIYGEFEKGKFLIGSSFNRYLLHITEAYSNEDNKIKISYEITDTANTKVVQKEMNRWHLKSDIFLNTVSIIEKVERKKVQLTVGDLV